MSKFTTLIVGAHFRPPAKQVFAFLPAGSELTLERDPENPYDPNAVKVFVDPLQIPESKWGELDAQLLECGITVEQVVSTGPVWIGFVPASEGKPLQKARAQEPGLIGNIEVLEIMQAGEYTVELSSGLDGSPRAVITTPAA